LIVIGGEEFTLSEMSIDLLSPSREGALRLMVSSEDRRGEFGLELYEEDDTPNYRFRLQSDERVQIKRGGRAEPEEMSDFFYDNPPIIWFADGSALEGNQYVELKNVKPPYSAAKIHAWDWAGTNIRKESQGTEKRADSVQAKVIRELRTRDYHMIIDDDGKGEVADVVAIRIQGELTAPTGIEVEFYHCKYSGGAEPGQRIDDLYEVCGQAQKSIRWMCSSEKRSDLFTHLLRREAGREEAGLASRYEVGDTEMLQMIREMSLVNSDHRHGSPVSLGIDWHVLTFAGGICLSAAIVFGLAPALRFLRVKPGLALKEGGRDSGPGRKGVLGRVLIGSQIALGVLVLMTAGLLVRSLRNLQEADLGYSRDQLLLARVDFLQSGYKGTAIQNVTQELLDRLSSLPGVHGVTASSNGLFSGDESSDAIRIDGVAPSNQQDNETHDDEVGPNYFSTIGVPIVLGREITQEDFAKAVHVAVVNESFAKFYFGARSPIGHKIYMQDSEHPDQPPYDIIGVARDVHDHNVRDAVRRRMYAPLTSATFDDIGAYNFEIRAIGNPQALFTSVRKAIRELNPNLIIDNMETAGELVTDTLTSQALVAKLAAFFGGLVLMLVCVGLYGSLAYNVAGRTREIGVRMALGAPRRNVMWMVIREALIVFTAGVTIGLPFGIAATRLFKAMLFGITTTDPLSIASAILALIVIWTAAAIIPVRRATRVDPIVALRYE
jgi:hypothetical protein